MAAPWAGPFFTPHLPAENTVVRAIEAEALPDPVDFDAVVVSGSRASVNDPEPWVDRVRGFVARALEHGVPYLGVCWGHQMLASALGVPVVRRAVPEVGFLEVALERGDPVIDALPARFRPFVVHEDEIGVDLGPLVGLGRSETCPVHAVRLPDQRAWGVQFHLEYPRHEVQRILEQRFQEHPELDMDPTAIMAGMPDLEPQMKALCHAFLDQVRSRA